MYLRILVTPPGRPVPTIDIGVYYLYKTRQNKFNRTPAYFNTSTAITNQPAKRGDYEYALLVSRTRIHP